MGLFQRLSSLVTEHIVPVTGILGVGFVCVQSFATFREGVGSLHRQSDHTSGSGPAPSVIQVD